jgi:hypothetical protein
LEEPGSYSSNDIAGKREQGKNRYGKGNYHMIKTNNI